MAHRCVRKFRFVKPAKFVDVRRLHASPAALDALAIPLAGFSTASIPTPSSSSAPRPIDVIRARKAEEIRTFLSSGKPSPNRVWASYLELLHIYGSAKVPLDVHQSVLRKCAPPAANVRAMAAKLRAEGRRYTDDRLYESRFQQVIRNIRTAGDKPTIEDYHCVLELFAAVGNHEGAMLVLREIDRVGLHKEPRTYGLALQALCHRLSLPIWHEWRQRLADNITEQCISIVKEMAARRVGYTAGNVDLAFRILKETLNKEGFAVLLRHAYGIDLAYPDRPPLEYWDKKRSAGVEVEGQNGSPVPFPSQLPFSVAAFNTALDFLASAKDVSKLVQMFEVMIAPLLSTSSSQSSYDDDEDEDFGVSNPQVAPYKPPHVVPNSKSFYFILKGVADAGHPVLARHYLLMAIRRDRLYGRQLREWTKTKPPDEIPAPSFAINSSHFLPVHHLANRDKDVELLRWVNSKVEFHIRRKKYDIEYYTMVRDRWIQEGVHRPVQTNPSEHFEELDVYLPSRSAASLFSTFFDPSSSARKPETSSTAGPTPLHFPVDLAASPTSPLPPQKLLNIDLHLRLLQRDCEGLEQLARRTEDALGRSSQRLKERLGRRVWAGKDIYVRDAGRRVELPRAVWRERVNFREQREVEKQRDLRESARQEKELRQERESPITHQAAPKNTASVTPNSEVNLALKDEEVRPEDNDSSKKSGSRE